MNQSHERKKLQSQLTALEAEISAGKEQIRGLQSLNSERVTQAKALAQKIEALDNPSVPRVSEHALLRYLERVRGIDLSEIAAEILSPEVLGYIETLGGSGKFPNKNYRVVMKDNVVTTIYI